MPLFLLSTDYLCLTDDFIVQTDKAQLIDVLLGGRHLLAKRALPVLAALRDGVTVHDLKVLAVQQHISDNELTVSLDLLNMCGALRRRRSTLQAIRAWQQQFKKLQFYKSYTSLSHRRRFSLPGLVVCYFRASWIFFASLCLLGMFMVIVHLSTAGIICRLSCLGLVCFTSSVLIHELAHTLVLRWYGQPVAIIQHGMRLGLLHNKLPKGIEIAVTIAGPLVGIAYTLSLLIVAVIMEAHSLAVLLTIVVFIQLCSLLPWYADGQSLRQALQKN